MTPSHPIRRTRSSRLPRRLVAIDTETIGETLDHVERHRLRCFVASQDRLDQAGRPESDPELLEGEDGAELWWWVTHTNPQKHKTWLYAHNIQFDLLASGAFIHLPELGWKLEGWNIGGRADWFSWRRGRVALICLNSASWLPMPLAEIGHWIASPKHKMPEKGSGLESWLEYCTQDVLIVRAAMLRLIQWVHDRELGSWKYTPAAQGFTAWRHKFMTRWPYHHGIERVERLERLAYHAGRCESYRVGVCSGGPFYEVDFRNAYPRVYAESLVPTSLVAVYRDVPLDAYASLPSGHGAIAECRIETETPCVPARTNRGTCYPVGRFRTWLAQPEIDLALSAGARVELVELALYTLSETLQPFGSWVLDALEGPNAISDPIIAALVKRWGQSFVGRLGARKRRWARVADDPERGVMVEFVAGAERDRMHRRTRLAGAWWEEQDDGESPQSATFISAWVTSAARVRLAAAMRVAGQGSTLYCDTDGLIVDLAGLDRLQAATDVPELAGLRVKRRINRLELLGPGAYLADDHARVKGLPRGARAGAGGEFTAERWQGVVQAIATGEIETPRVERRRQRVARPELRGTAVVLPAQSWAMRYGYAQAEIAGWDGVTVVEPYRLWIRDGMNVIHHAPSQ